MEWLFCFVVVLNGEKQFIEKMLGFEGRCCPFFLNPCFFFFFLP